MPSTPFQAAADAGSRDWMETFRPFSLQHLIAAGAIIGVVALVSAAGAAWAGSMRGRRLTRGIAFAAIVYWVAVNTWWNWLRRPFDLQNALPLHVSDLLGLIAPLALLTRHRVLRATLYFWALALGTQSLLTPVIRVGPASLVFWGFWTTHAFILTCAVYDVAARGYRPAWRDLGIAAAATVGYLAVVLPLNLLMGTNYGYVGKTTPENPTLLDVLGPWPVRVLWMALLAGAAFLLVYLPWPICRWIAERRRGTHRRDAFS